MCTNIYPVARGRHPPSFLIPPGSPLGAGGAARVAHLPAGGAGGAGVAAAQVGDWQRVTFSAAAEVAGQKPLQTVSSQLPSTRALRVNRAPCFTTKRTHEAFE